MGGGDWNSEYFRVHYSPCLPLWRQYFVAERVLLVLAWDLSVQHLAISRKHLALEEYTPEWSTTSTTQDTLYK